MTIFVIGRSASGDFEVSQTIESAPKPLELSDMHQAFALNASGITGQSSSAPATRTAQAKSWTRDYQT